jgi:hypothetical protein
LSIGEGLGYLSKTDGGGSAANEVKGMKKLSSGAGELSFQWETALQAMSLKGCDGSEATVVKNLKQARNAAASSISSIKQTTKKPAS